MSLEELARPYVSLAGICYVLCVHFGLGGVCAPGYANGGGGVPVSGCCALAMSGVLFRVLWVFCARSAGTLGAYFGSCAFIAGMLVGTCAASRVVVTGGAPGCVLEGVGALICFL